MELANGHARAVIADQHAANGYYIRKAREFYGYDWGAYDACLRMIRQGVCDVRRYRLRRCKGVAFSVAQADARRFVGDN